MKTIDTPSGPRVLVEPGDSPWRIAEQYTGDGLRWPELVRANPEKPRSPSGAFLTLTPGEKLLVPASWREQFGCPHHADLRDVGSHDAGAVSPDAGALPSGWVSSDIDIVRALADAFGLTTDDLLAIWYSESGLKPRIVTPAGAYEYAGLIEGLTRPAMIDQTLGWPPGTWKTIVTERPLAVQLQAISQIWDKTFKTYLRGETIGSFADRMDVSPAAVAYALNFLPARVGGLQTKLSPLTKSTDKDPSTRSGSFYGDNPGLDLDKDGAITLHDLDLRIASKIASFRSDPSAQALASAARQSPGGTLAALLAPYSSTWVQTTGKQPVYTVGYRLGEGQAGGEGGLIAFVLLLAGLWYARKKKVL